MLKLPYRSKFEISIAADLGKKNIGLSMSLKHLVMYQR